VTGLLAPALALAAERPLSAVELAPGRVPVGARGLVAGALAERRVASGRVRWPLSRERRSP